MTDRYEIIDNTIAEIRKLRERAHHPDYSKPFEVLWLCNRDHVAAHRGGE